MSVGLRLCLSLCFLRQDSIVPIAAPQWPNWGDLHDGEEKDSDEEILITGMVCRCEKCVTRTDIDSDDSVIASKAAPACPIKGREKKDTLKQKSSIKSRFHLRIKTSAMSSGSAAIKTPVVMHHRKPNSMKGIKGDAYLLQNTTEHRYLVGVSRSKSSQYFQIICALRDKINNGELQTRDEIAQWLAKTI